MTSFETQTLNTLAALMKDIGYIKRRLKVEEKKDVWLSEKEAMDLTKLSKKSLQVMRREGTVEFKCRKSGRGFQYSKESIEKLLIKS